jgi:DNA-binding CsgD family transcriptional regulator
MNELIRLKAFRAVIHMWVGGKWAFVRKFKLTPGEIAVLVEVLFNSDAPKKTLAENLGLSVGGFEYHLTNLCEKTGIPAGANRRAALLSKFYGPFSRIKQ